MDVERVPFELLKVNPERFQVRLTAYAETVADAIALHGWREEKGGVFTLWQNGDGLYVLDGHSRRAGILRLKPKNRPTTVRALVHRELTEAEAIALAKEMNPSSAPLTPCEMAKLTYEAYQQTREIHPEWPSERIFQHLAGRFSGIGVKKLRSNMVLALLPGSLVKMVDQDDFPLAAGRALGKFIRDTGCNPEQVTKLAQEFMRSGMPVLEFTTFLGEHQASLRRATQDDMFGEIVTVQFAALAELRAVVARQERELALIRCRRDAFRSLHGTAGAATPEQLAVLERDDAREGALADELAAARLKLGRALKFGVS